MKAFADTSALYAVMSSTDARHHEATATYRRLLDEATPLVTSSYVVVEVLSLLQRRHGLDPATSLWDALNGAFDIHWVDETLHRLAWARLRTLARRDVSLVDCVSFELMDRLRLRHAFTYDAHFDQAGFSRL